MGQYDILPILVDLRKKDDYFRSVKQIRQEMEDRGMILPGYARTHHSLMALARSGWIEVEKRPDDPLKEWVRRFRGLKGDSSD